MESGFAWPNLRLEERNEDERPDDWENSQKQRGREGVSHRVLQGIVAEYEQIERRQAKNKVDRTIKRGLENRISHSRPRDGMIRR